MARSWRDYAGAEPRDDSDNSDISRADQPQAEPFVPNVPFVTALPAPVAEGLALLSQMGAPRLIHPDRWPVAVADAQRLASEGWALAAFRLGWSALDLFGVVPDKAGDPQADGLAVKLAGRRVLEICATVATVADANGGRSYLYRVSNEGARLLWALGRGRG
jgi:hypothetical protein